MLFIILINALNNEIENNLTIRQFKNLEIYITKVMHKFDMTLHKYLPLKSGHIFHTPRPPIFRNWPNDVSRRNVGIPAKKSVSRYGTKKAPGRKKSKQYS